jgi:hypothetical protein
MDPIRDDLATWFAWTGYMHEVAVLKLMGDTVNQETRTREDGTFLKIQSIEYRPRELIAPWDDRYKGHIDHELGDGTLIEIKSVSFDTFSKMQEARKPRWKDRAQVQVYMRYGEFPHGILVYVPRDIPLWAWEKKANIALPFWCVGVKRNERWMDEVDEKARTVLAAMSRGEPPTCTCKRCER